MSESLLTEEQAGWINELLVAVEGNLMWESEVLEDIGRVWNDKGITQARAHIEKARQALFGILPEPGDRIGS